MTLDQRLSLMQLLLMEFELSVAEKYPLNFHHGCCIGSDFEAVLLAKFLRLFVVAHIPSDRSRMHQDAYSLSDQIVPGDGYLGRNRDIVTVSDMLYATPYEGQKDGGTNYTIDYAIKNGVPVTIVHWDGSWENK